MHVESVTVESVSGKRQFSIMLSPIQSSNSNHWTREVNFNNYSADKIAELRTRMLLLGEPLPVNLSNFYPFAYDFPSKFTVPTDKDIFSSLWQQLGRPQQKYFLPQAWLWVAYCLKMSYLIENIFKLELGPIKSNIMPISFQGQRKSLYTNQKPYIIDIVGECTLKN